MRVFTLSTGVKLLSDDIERAEYFPYRLTAHEQDFLYIETLHGAICVQGKGAAQDALVLEQEEIPVRRLPIPCWSLIAT